MKIQITYEYKSANGFSVRHVAFMTSYESAEATCKFIEQHEGYKIIDVTRIE